MTHRGGWGHVIAVLAKYLSLREDWPLTSPLGRLDDGGSDDVSRDVPGQLAWLADVGTCLEALDAYERQCVLEVAMLRDAEDRAQAMARNHRTAAERSQSVSDVRDAHLRTKSDWKERARKHRQERRRIEERQAYQHGMDHMSVLVVRLASDRSGETHS